MIVESSANLTILVLFWEATLPYVKPVLTAYKKKKSLNTHVKIFLVKKNFFSHLQCDIAANKMQMEKQKMLQGKNEK